MSVDRRKVSQGNPGLVPERRRQIDLSLLTRDSDRKNLERKIAADSATVAPDGEIDTTGLRHQLGRPFSSSQIIERLKKCNRALSFEPSLVDSGKIGIYVLENRPDPLTHKTPWKRFVCGMERGFSPEFSVRHFRRERVPDPDLDGNWKSVNVFSAETRGWRTVLMRLLRSGLISEPQINRYFPLGRDSHNWQVLTR